MKSFRPLLTMHLHWPRLTVRRLMALVAIMGVLLGTILGVERRRATFRRLHRHYETEANLLLLKRTDNVDSPFYSRLNWGESIAKRRRLEGYYWSMTVKYELVIERPWLPLAPDPPEPESPTRSSGTSIMTRAMLVEPAHRSRSDLIF
jgi:hypothetical protein